MSTDDDQIRRSLSAGRPPFTAHSALRELRPSMQRARMRRRVAVGATAAALLVGGGAGVFALTAGRDKTTLRSVTSDQTGQPLPTVIEAVVTSTTVSTTVAALEELPVVIEPSTTVAPTSTPSDEGDRTPTEGRQTGPAVDETPAMPAPADPPTAATPPTEAAPPAAATPPAAPAPTPASFQTITSACGEVVVSIDAGAVRIVTIAARPGFDQQVHDTGPTSIEMTFAGEGDQKCEIHAELKSGELDVEVQNFETAR
ncbi:MAG: hypothetical protein E4H05_02450 [Acidimicrobiales bacterium]|nr:MAG: hypothetical protein E4H05_02450 [Acidimicrobiales bacterium]